MSKSRETYSKKERENQRMKRLQDKKAKSEERKANSKRGSNLEDMMAYLDENGNLTDTPPDPRKRREVKQEDIQIGVPARSNEPDVPKLGKVSFFNTAKGFGFIIDAQTGERLFFHISDLAGPISEMDSVSFDIGRSARGPCAVNIKKSS
jgi:cold shock CspA family protein